MAGCWRTPCGPLGSWTCWNDSENALAIVLEAAEIGMARPFAETASRLEALRAQRGADGVDLGVARTEAPAELGAPRGSGGRAASQGSDTRGRVARPGRRDRSA